MRRLVLALVAVPVLYVLAGFLGAVFPGSQADLRGAPTERIGLARGAIHYDILLPLSPEMRRAFGFAQRAGLPMQHPQAQWLVVGWGAEGFYTTVGQYTDIRPAVMWRAATGDTAVLRLDLAGDVSTIEAIDWIDAAPAQIAALQEIVLGMLTRDAAGQPEALPPAPWGQTHVFYRAKGRFNIIHTCNAWVGEALRAAGFGLGAWVPTTQAMKLSLWLHG